MIVSIRAVWGGYPRITDRLFDSFAPLGQGKIDARAHSRGLVVAPPTPRRDGSPFGGYLNLAGMLTGKLSTSFAPGGSS